MKINESFKNPHLPFLKLSSSRILIYSRTDFTTYMFEHMYCYHIENKSRSQTKNSNQRLNVRTSQRYKRVLLSTQKTNQALPTKLYDFLRPPLFFRSFLSFPRFPTLTAFFIPSLVRSLIILRSNSAKAPSICI